MSELKAYKGDVAIPVYGTIADAEVCLKSEADKVIAEKDKEIAELKALKAQAEDDCAYWKMCHGNAEKAMHETEEYAMQLYRSDRHNKYKRCLAMAKVCFLRLIRYENYLQKLCASNATIAVYKFRRDLYDKWETRWLEFAEKCKGA